MAVHQYGIPGRSFLSISEAEERRAPSKTRLFSRTTQVLQLHTIQFVCKEFLLHHETSHPRLFFPCYRGTYDISLPPYRPDLNPRRLSSPLLNQRRRLLSTELQGPPWKLIVARRFITMLHVNFSRLCYFFGILLANTGSKRWPECRPTRDILSEKCWKTEVLYAGNR